MLRLSRESNPGPPALQANTLCKEPFERRISCHSESHLVLLHLHILLRPLSFSVQTIPYLEVEPLVHFTLGAHELFGTFGSLHLGLFASEGKKMFDLYEFVSGWLWTQRFRGFHLLLYSYLLKGFGVVFRIRICSFGPPGDPEPNGNCLNGFGSGAFHYQAKS